MKAWEVTRPGPIDSGPLSFVERDVPEPGPGEMRVRVSVCGVCRTDLHVAEGDLPVHKQRVVPGHEIVGRVDKRGPGAERFALGDRIGIAWLRHTCGVCRFCTAGRENLCVAPGFTGYDADGGYAEHALVPEDYAYPLPDDFDDEHAAPLLCAGIIGFRALKRSRLPEGGALGIYGFGGSAHLTAQIALHQGACVHVVTRSEKGCQLARELGVESASTTGPPPEPLDAAILFAPAGGLVPAIMEALERGGRLAIAGIHLSNVPELHYERHLFMEKEIVSVTANTRADGREFLEQAAAAKIAVAVDPYPLNHADRALSALARDEVRGAAVLRVES
ncbi:MAG: zinc-dependent alcohol dehydrogenase family protein [Actinomycetota bacterium]